MPHSKSIYALARQRILENFVLQAIFITPCMVAQAAESSDTTATGGKKRILSGGITHSEQLAPLPASLSPGQPFLGFAMHRSELLKSSQPDSTPSQPATTGQPTNKELQNAAVKKQQQQHLDDQSKLSGQHATGVTGNAYGKQIGNRKVSPQVLKLLEQQAKLGNTGTQGLKNYLQSNASISLTQPAKKITKGESQAPLKQTTPPTQQKFAVPLWLAGAWLRSEATELSRVELPSKRALKPFGKGVARVRDEFGNYRDAQGRIWQIFDPAKASGSVDRGNATDYHTVSSYKLTSNSDRTAIVTLRATHVVVDKQNKRIIKAYQDEELNTYTKIDDNHVRTDSSVKVFDHQGKPQLLTEATSVETKLSKL